MSGAAPRDGDARPQALGLVARRIVAETGLARISAPALAAAVERTAPGEAAGVVARRLDDPLAGPALLRRLIDEVTVKETSFLRDPVELAAVDWRRLAERPAARGGPLRVWSAACATGEEAYTLAILSREALGAGAPPAAVLGTDVSEAALALAARARYRPRAVAGLPPALRAAHLRDEGETIVVARPVRAQVRLRRHNLARDGAPPQGEEPFDVVVCRNVLIYFEEATAARVAAELRHAVRPGGLLVLGAADALHARRATAEPDRLRGASDAARPPRRPRSRVAPPRPSPRPAAPSHVREPLDPDAWLHRGLTLVDGDAGRAVEAFRRALLLRPDFPVAAFQLGRAHERCGDRAAARRAYGQALRALASPGCAGAASPVAAADLAGACRARLRALG